MIFLEALALEAATLERVMDPPTGALGYGTDWKCTTDVTADFAEIDPFSVEGLFESSVRRLSTKRGELPDGGDPNDLEYGYDLTALLNHPATAAEIAEHEGRASGEVEKDEERIAAAKVRILSQELGKKIRVSLSITPRDPNLSEFTSTFAITPEGLEVE